MKPVPALEGFTAYHVPGKRCPIDVRLDGNEGAQPSPEVLAALSEPTPDLVRRYPDAALLESRIAARHGVNPECVMVTAGADEALDRACRALLGPGRELIMPVPTFEMLGKYARLVGADVRTVAWPQGDYPVEAVLSAITPSTAAIAVVSPNNPTGAVARPADVERLCAAAPHAAVFVDGAYEEFADAPLAEVALRHRNALLFKTLSKAWGVAGLRVGYVIGTPEAIGWIRCAGSPYSVSGPSLLLAERLLQDGDAPVESFVTRVRGERAALSTLLSDLGAEVLPSQANFVMVRHPRWRHIWEGLAGLGVAVRAFPDRPHLEHALRITVPGREDWYARLEAGLRAVLHPQALLFDMDGVLADVSGSYNAAIVQTAAHFGALVTHTDVAEMKARGDANNDWIVTRRLLAERGIDVTLDAVTAAFEQVYQGTPDTPGLRATERLTLPREALARLAARLPLAVVTGRPRADAERFLIDHQISDLFRACVCMDDGPRKPDPFPVRLALQRLGVDRAWMVGDTPDDVRAARAAGVMPLGIVAPGDDPQTTPRVLEMAGAGRVLTTLDELEEMLP